MKYYWKCVGCGNGPCYAITQPCLSPKCFYHLMDRCVWRKMYSWQIQIWITWILCVITLIALWFGVGGCTKTAMKRIVTRELIQRCHLPNPVITEYTVFTHFEFLMRSKMEGAEMVVDGDYRHLAIESREQMPDPNTVKAITDGVVSGLVGL